MLLRTVVAGTAGALAGILSNHAGGEDFLQIWVAFRLLMGAEDPYALIGPGRPVPMEFPLFYPVTASVVVAPLGVLPANWGRSLFAAGGAFAFAMAITRDGWARAPWLLSYPFLSCLFVAQWSTWLAAAVVYPALAFMAPGKPNTGLVMLAGMRQRREIAFAALGGGAVILLATLLWPTGWLRWWMTTRDAKGAHITPLLLAQPLGLALLLAALRWRSAGARTLLALAVVPHNPLPHNALMLVPTVEWRWWQTTILAAVSWLAVPYVWAQENLAPDITELARRSGLACVVLLYLPTLLVELTRRRARDL